MFQDICTNSNSCFTNLARDQHFKSTDTHTHARAEKFGRSLINFILKPVEDNHFYNNSVQTFFINELNASWIISNILHGRKHYNKTWPKMS